MNAREFQSIAGTLLSLLDAGDAAPVKRLVGAEPAAAERGLQMPIAADAIETAALLGIAGEPAAQISKMVDAGEQKMNIVRFAEAAENDSPLVESPEAGDIMESIDSFFRRDSRRYDRGF